MSDQKPELTEQEWLAGHDLDGMLRYLSGRVSERKFRLTECAFLRRFWHLLTDDRNRQAVAVAERFADGLATNEELQSAYANAEEAFDQILHKHFPDAKPTRPYWGGAVSAAQHTASSVYDLPKLFAHRMDPERKPSMGSLVWIATAAYPLGADAEGVNGHDAIDAEAVVQATLLHDLFGNPFRPVSLDRSWLLQKDQAAVSLAKAVYEQRSFDRMSELADALEQSGCTSSEVLDHCRGPGPHVKGCWVIDLLLGKT